MLTVIIPTVQKRLKILMKSLKYLQEDDSVTEIIVINNKIDEPLDLTAFSKVKLYTPEENLYVNESWNLGVELAINNKFCLMNDDVLFYKNFCSDLMNTNLLQSLTTGLIGINPTSIKNIEEAEDFDYPDSPVPPTSIAFINMNDKYLHTDDWGIAIFGKKEDYCTIPNKYKILFGDNWLLYKTYLQGLRNYAIVNMTCHHVHSASSASSEFTAVVCSDISNANNSEEFGGKV